MSHPATLVGFPGHRLRVGSARCQSPMEATWGRGFHHHETWNCFLPTSAWLPGRARGRGAHPVPTKSCPCCWGGGGCRAAGSAAVKPRRSSRQGRRPMTPTPPGSNSTWASIAMSCTPAGTRSCPRCSGIWPRKGSSAPVPPPCPHPCPHPCPSARLPHPHVPPFSPEVRRDPAQAHHDVPKLRAGPLQAHEVSRAWDNPEPHPHGPGR